ncbi:efflux RND transporter periplasmic adaptor subunit [Litorimonas haliclonae]|uniref:efflux RND transporter periplasmic adaptor subunit n=1 Tax=Litorimonas haliclonae TaxID=2081977 RepID=UPI0039EDF686
MSNHYGHIVFCGIALSVMLAGCGDNSASPETQASAQTESSVEIIPHTVVYQEDVISVEAIGTARAEKFAVIRADSGGEVTRVNFKAGDRVEKGDVLLTLESDEERLAANRAEVALKNSQQLIDRYERIDVPGAISDSQIDEAKTAVEAAQIDLELADVALSRRAVRAPFSGTVGLTDIDAGARITPETEITRLDDRSTLFVDFQAPEQVYSCITPGDTISMEPFSGQGRTYEATVLTIDSRIDQVSRSFTVRAAIDNEDDTLRPGMSFKIGFDVAGQAYPVVPEAAIIWGGDGAYVWAVEKGRATRVSVTIVDRQDGNVLVRAPIPEGNTIISEGVQKVREGTPVDLTRINPTTSAIEKQGPTGQAPNMVEGT